MPTSLGSSPVLTWLLEEDQPSVRFYALTELLGRANDDPEVISARSQIAERGWAHKILATQKPAGNWESVKDLYRPKYTATNWMALVLSDLGLTREDGRIRKMAELFFEQWMQEKKENIFNDEVCIVGNTARMLTRFGYAEDRRVAKLFDRLVEDQKRDGGWHCRDSPTGTLDGWEALAAFAELPESKRSRRIRESISHGVEFYLERGLLEEGRRYPPWYRLHYPNHYYYDVLVGLDLVTKLGYGADRRLEPALKVLKDKRRDDGTWPLERVHPDPPGFGWGRWNLKWEVKPFALEKAAKPSKWITLKALLVLKRTEGLRTY